MTFDAAWTPEDLAKHLCDDLVANGLLKEKPAFIRTDREKVIADIFVKMGLDGAKMGSFKDSGPLETLLRTGTQGQAWIDSVLKGLISMLPKDVAKAQITIGMSEEAKQEMEEAQEKSNQARRAREEGGKSGGGYRDDNNDEFANFGGRNRDGGGGRGGDQECFNCGEVGHISRDCTERRKPKGGGKGGGRDRDDDDAFANFGGRDRGGGGSDQGCFNCGEVGHMSRDCDAPRKPKGGGKSRGGGDQECFNCGQVGHMSRDCDEPRRPKGGGKGDRGDRDYNRDD